MFVAGGLSTYFVILRRNDSVSSRSGFVPGGCGRLRKQGYGPIRTATIHIDAMPFLQHILSLKNFRNAAPFVSEFVVSLSVCNRHEPSLRQTARETDLFSSHNLSLPSAVVSHSNTPKMNGHTVLLRSPTGLTPRRNTSLLISSSLTVGRPVLSNQLNHISVSTGCLGTLVVFGVGRFEVLCKSSKIPSEELSSPAPSSEDGIA